MRLCLSVCIALASTPLSAATSEPPTARYLLVVASNHSFASGVQDLAYADDDAALYVRQLGPYARSFELLTTFDDDSQRRYPELVSRSRPPTLANLRAALASLYAQAGAAERQGFATELVFIFVGHGSRDDAGRGQLHLADGPFTRADLFHEVVGASPARRTHLIIDACSAFSVVAGRGAKEATSTQSELNAFLAGNDLADYPTVGALTLTSDDRETHEWSRLRAGVFSHEVRAALAGAADVNRDGRLEYSEVAAFVDAAASGLDVFGKHFRTFVWPPAQDRRAPLLDLRDGRGTRVVVLGERLSGHYSFESDRGERWAELHKDAGAAVILALPANERFFFRSASAETEIAASTEIVRLDEPPSSPLALVQRGSLDWALSEGLFARAFSDAYYRGFLSGHPKLVPVNEVALPWADVAPRAQLVRPAGAGSPSSSWQLGVGYAVGRFVLRRDHLEHVMSLSAQRPLGGGLSAGLRVDLAYTGLSGTASREAVRLGIMLGAGYEHPLFPWLVARAGVEGGYGVLGLRGEGLDVDPFVPTMRACLGLGMPLTGAVRPRLDVALSGYLVTLAHSEQLRGEPQLLVGLDWP
jgi:hypothetical protein